MDGTYTFMFLMVAIAFFVAGTIVGYKYALRSVDRRIKEQAEQDLLRRKRILHDSGRRLPARENAGPPIRVQKVTFRRRHRK